jgi:hypothetical protein
MIQQTCINCHNLFLAKTDKKKYCSENCRYTHIKRLDIKPIAECIICGTKFLKTRRDRVRCSATCIIPEESRKYRIKIRNKKRDKLLSISKNYCDDIKRRGYYLNEADIFRLIDIHDRIWPGRTINDSVRKDLLYEQLLTEVILWTIKEEKKLKSSEDTD